MLTAYCDDAGGEDHGFTVISGWISSSEKWDIFEVDWRIFLAHYDVPYLHMKKLAHFSEPYDRWKGQESTRRSFMQDAAEIINSIALNGFIAYCGHRDFRTVNGLFQLEETFGGPYGLAGRSCIELIDDWRKKQDFDASEVHYVFEDGKGKGEVLKSMRSITPHLRDPDFEPSADVEPCTQWPEGRNGVVQLQAADFLAYESRKGFADFKRGVKPHRKSLGALLQKVPVIMGGASPSMQLARFCLLRNVRKRLPPDSAIYASLSPG
jgi:hypothetical protein